MERCVAVPLAGVASGRRQSEPPFLADGDSELHVGLDCAPHARPVLTCQGSFFSGVVEAQLGPGWRHSSVPRLSFFSETAGYLRCVEHVPRRWEVRACSPVSLPLPSPILITVGFVQ